MYSISLLLKLIKNMPLLAQLLCLASMSYALYQAVKLFRNKRIQRRFRMQGAFSCLGLAFFVMLTLAGNVFISDFAIVGMICIIVFNMASYYKSRSEHKVTVHKAEKSVKDMIHQQDVFQKKLEKLMTPKEREKNHRFAHKMKTDPEFRKRQMTKHADDIKYIKQGKFSPKMKKSMENLQHNLKLLSDKTKQMAMFTKAMHQMLNENPQLKHEYLEYEKRFKQDKQFKADVDNKRGAGWKEFKPFRDKIHKLSLDRVKKKDLQILNSDDSVKKK